MKEQFYPFSSPLEKSGIEEMDPASENYIHQLRDNPEVIVREVRSSMIFLTMEKQEVAAIAKKEFDMLRDTYSIHTDAQYVIAGDQRGDEVIYGVTKRVHTDQVDQQTIDQEKGELIEKLLHYYQDKLATFDPKEDKIDYYLHDIVRGDQYVYGHTKDDSVSILRLVDIDPEHIGDTVEGILLVLEEFSETMIEEHVRWAKQNGQSLEHVRKPLQNILLTLVAIEGQKPSHTTRHLLIKLKDTLEQIFS